MRDTISQALNFRHACKIFDESKGISQEDFESILESAVMAPSSMGAEPTRLEVIDSKELREQLQARCWHQPQITTASKVVVLKNLISDINLLEQSHTIYMDQVSMRRGKTQEEREKWLDKVRVFLQDKEANGEKVGNWTAKQGYITAGFMMLSAALLGIDTCAIEGFNQREVEDLLGIDREKERLNLILCFGHRIKPQQERYRLDKDILIKYR